MNDEGTGIMSLTLRPKKRCGKLTWDEMSTCKGRARKEASSYELLDVKSVGSSATMEAITMERL